MTSITGTAILMSAELPPSQLDTMQMDRYRDAVVECRCCPKRLCATHHALAPRDRRQPLLKTGKCASAISLFTLCQETKPPVQHLERFYHCTYSASDLSYACIYATLIVNTALSAGPRLRYTERTNVQRSTTSLCLSTCASYDASASLSKPVATSVAVRVGGSNASTSGRARA